MKLPKNCFAIIEKLLAHEKLPIGMKFNPKLFLELKSKEYIAIPFFIFWDPMSTNSLHCPLCLEDSQIVVQMASAEWEKGQSNSMIPRTIWDVGWYVAIVGRKYNCRNKHSIVSYHPGILNQIDKDTSPFLLSHDSGMTKSLFDMVLRLIDNGNTFSRVQDILKEFFVDNFYRECLSVSVESNIGEFFDQLNPSDDFIRKCYLISYNDSKNLYEKVMSDIKFEYISMDHTFKSATNIGFLVNGKWQKLYSTLFIAMNEKGQVIEYKLCSGSSFEEIKSNVETLAYRNQNVPMIYIDNCCSWRNQLFTIFPNTKVQCDTFHGIQRLVKTISKRHVYCFEACKELSLIFRFPNDFGKERLQSTPPPDVIMKNIEIFLQKWKDIEFKDWKLLRKAFFKALDNLKVHIQKGCFSDIPKGHGTNKNENLHKQLRNVLPRNRIAVDTALSLFNAVFYYHNVKKSMSKFVDPIWKTRLYHEEYLSRRSTNDCRDTSLEEWANKDELPIDEDMPL